VAESSLWDQQEWAETPELKTMAQPITRERSQLAPQHVLLPLQEMLELVALVQREHLLLESTIISNLPLEEQVELLQEQADFLENKFRLIFR
jgi:hypothetical protein